MENGLKDTYMVQDMKIAEVYVGSINMYRSFILHRQPMEEQEIPNQPVPSYWADVAEVAVQEH